MDCLDKYFREYENLVKLVMEAFDRVKEQFPDKVVCKAKCADCCYALFDVTLIEAMYLNHHFNQKFTGMARHDMLERANRADRKLYKLKKKAGEKIKDGSDDVQILGEISMERVRCPLLNAQDECDLYAFRPIACRVYGIPTSAQGTGHTCGHSGFVQGESYPTMNMDTVYQRLYDISCRFVREINSRYSKLGDFLVPVSMALMTDFDSNFLGTTPEQEAK